MKLRYHNGCFYNEKNDEEVIPAKGDVVLEPSWSYVALNEDIDKKWDRLVKRALNKQGLTSIDNVIKEIE